MKTWTIEEMLKESPCASYDRARIEALWAGRPQLSLREILDLEIPAQDRLWVCWRPHALTANQREAAVLRIVTRAIETHARHCGVLAVETWAERWLSGVDRSTEAAWAAAEAEEAAAWAAARAAGWAARAASAGAAWWAAGAASAGAAWWAAGAASAGAASAGAASAGAAEYTHQLDDVRAVL